MSFPSLDIPGAPHIHVLTPWWLFLVYSFFHPRSWKHKIGEKEEEKNHQTTTSVFFLKKPQQAGPEYSRNGGFFSPTSQLLLFKRILINQPCKIHFSLIFLYFYPNFAARPEKWLRWAVCFFPPLTVVSPLCYWECQKQTLLQSQHPNVPGWKSRFSSHLPRARLFQLHTSRSCLLLRTDDAESLSSSFHTQFLPAAPSAQILGINGSAEASRFNLFPWC